MSREIFLSEDELSTVRRALERDLESSRFELRHTRNLSYRADVKEHIQELERLLNLVFSVEHTAVHV